MPVGIVDKVGAAVMGGVHIAAIEMDMRAGRTEMWKRISDYTPIVGTVAGIALEWFGRGTIEKFGRGMADGAIPLLELLVYQAAKAKGGGGGATARGAGVAARASGRVIRVGTAGGGRPSGVKPAPPVSVYEI